MAPISRPLVVWYNKIAAFNVENLFVRKREPGPRRIVHVNENIPDHYYDHKRRVKPEFIYSTNQVITSKYTVFTFLPRNLLEQFRRVANCFFLGIAILQFFGKFSTISPGLVILPLLIVVGITALKDGYEDVKRHQSDRQVNHSNILVLSGGNWVNPNTIKKKNKTFVRGISKKALKVTATPIDVEAGNSEPQPEALPENGDVEYDDLHEEGIDHSLHLFGHHADSERPHWKKTTWEDVRVGDFVKIKENESLPADILIISTSEPENVAYVETKNLDGETNLKSRNATPALTHLRTARDCANVNNRFRLDCDRPDVSMFKLNASLIVDKEAVDKEKEKEEEPLTYPIDMQMVLLRGTVLRNTGWVIGVVMYTGEDTRIVLNSGGTPSKRSKVERQMNPQVFINLIILALMASVCGIVDSVLEHRYYPRGALWLYGDNLPDDNPSINGLVTWAFALITFQNIVPISLYISIEFVRTCQAAFIYFDSEIWYEKLNQPTLARSWNLADDLGQIEYIFSDKTGTLTQNLMVFRECSIGGKVYSGDPVDDLQDTMPLKEEPEIKHVDRSTSVSPGSGSSTQIPSSEPNTPDATAAVTTAAALKVHRKFHDTNLSQDLRSAVHVDRETDAAPHARALNGFFTVLALCHTVLAATDPVTGVIEYKAQSPDEAALVRAAADVGYVFKGREPGDMLVLQTPFGEERYELLHILEFTSVRKRMSVVVRRVDEGLDGGDRRLFLLCKGADNVVFERLKQGGGPAAEELKESTERHLGEFASQGLRTLTLAYKVIREDEYAAWSDRYHAAAIARDDREAQIEAVSDELEQDLRLLGATAIEDRLQDGVPETIADLKRAGIKIWVATGDKLETAIAIGHSTNLIGPEANIIVLRGVKHGRTVYEQMVRAVEEFFPESNIVDEKEKGKGNEKAGEHPPPLRRAETGLSSIVGLGNGDRPGGFVLVADGIALEHALANERDRSLLLRLATLCEGVVCCRVSPLQKALIVKLVKDGLGAMTLAIGDGANDVSMIQAADVGVGISGEEGLQAVNSSDYAIAQFRFLKRLLLVHGHWSYARNGNMINNFFYKNMVCIGVLWWFQIYAAWSAAYVFEYTYILWWNSFWTIAPVIAIGIFDRIVDADTLMAIPELYKFGREGRWFGLKWFSIYMIEAVIQSAIIYFLILYTYQSTTSRTDGFAPYLYEFSTVMVFSAVITANLFNGLNTNVWTWWVFFAVGLGMVLLLIYTGVYSAISPGWFSTPVWGNNHYLWPSAYFWLALPLTICLALAPRYIAKAYKFGFAPDDIDIMRYIAKKQPDRDVIHDPQLGIALRDMARPASALSRRTSRTESVASARPVRPSVDVRQASRTDMSTGERIPNRGFNFSTEEHGVAMRRMQTNLSERRESSRNLALPGQPKKKLSDVFSVRKGFLRRKPSTPKEED